MIVRRPHLKVTCSNGHGPATRSLRRSFAARATTMGGGRFGTGDVESGYLVWRPLEQHGAEDRIAIEGAQSRVRWPVPLSVEAEIWGVRRADKRRQSRVVLARFPLALRCPVSASW